MLQEMIISWKQLQNANTLQYSVYNFILLYFFKILYVYSKGKFKCHLIHIFFVVSDGRMLCKHLWDNILRLTLRKIQAPKTFLNVYFFFRYFGIYYNRDLMELRYNRGTTEQFFMILRTNIIKEFMWKISCE